MVLLAAVVLVSSRGEPPAPAPGATGTTTTYVNSDGLQITPLDVEHDEIADILDIERWRFHIVTPSPQSRIKYAVEVRRKGEPSREIQSGAMWGADGSDKEMVVALYPLGEPFKTAEKVKIYLRIGASRVAGVRENPLKGLGGMSRGSKAQRQNDESFLLGERSQSGHYPDPNNTLLVLTLNVAEVEGEHP
jgi:hypothetical protein